MASIAKRLMGRLRRLARSEDGTATVPVLIFVPFYLMFLLSSVEMGMLMIRHVLLERAVDLTVRDLRLGLWTPQNPANAGDELRVRICNHVGLIPQCNKSLMVELRPVSKVTWEPLSSGPNCVDRTRPVYANPLPDMGTSNEMMLIRACAKFNPIFPTTAMGATLPKDSTGAYSLVSATVFVNEPRPGT